MSDRDKLAELLKDHTRFTITLEDGRTFTAKAHNDATRCQLEAFPPIEMIQVELIGIKEVDEPNANG